MKEDSANPNAGEAETIFNGALAFSAAERPVYLAGACQDNLPLRQRVEALLAERLACCDACASNAYQRSRSGGARYKIGGTDDPRILETVWCQCRIDAITIDGGE